MAFLSISIFLIVICAFDVSASSCRLSPCCSDDYDANCRADGPNGETCYCDGECRQWGDCCNDRDDVCVASTSTPPPVCQYTEWGAWSRCSRTCGTGGYRHQTRSLRPQGCDSSTLGTIVLRESQRCNSRPCPVDCVESEWGTWSTCSQTCGPSQRSRQRTIVVRPANSGRPCGPLAQSSPCQRAPCPTDASGQCRDAVDSIAYDECGRRCVCERGELVRCCRVRKDITSMSRSERLRYIRAYKTAQTTYENQFRALLNIHRTRFFNGIHDRRLLLPWHRAYVLELENLLRRVDCRVTQPFWDWSRYADDPWNAPVWQDDPSWLGSNGDGRNGWAVGDGPFNCAPSGDCVTVRRRFRSSRTLPNSEAVERVLALRADDIDEWQWQMEGTLHNQFHCAVGGTMCTTDSANAPEFYLHHGYIDKLWNAWQRRSADRYDQFRTGFNTGEVLEGLGTTILSVLNVSRLPNDVCVVYDEPPRVARPRGGFRSATACQPPLDETFSLFRLDETAREKIIEANKRLCRS